MPKQLTRADKLFRRINKMDSINVAVVLSVAWGRMADRMTAEDLDSIEATTAIYEGA